MRRRGLWPRRLQTSMNKLLAISILTMITIPAATYADWIDDMVEAAKAGGGVVVESHSSASTGGQTASGGQTVTTGDVSASSHTQTTINTGSEGGTVEVKVQTSKNGETQTKEYSHKIDSSEGVHVEVAATASDQGSKEEVRVDGEVVESDVASHSAETEVTTHTADSPSFVESVPHFLKKVLNFFWWF